MLHPNDRQLFLHLLRPPSANTVEGVPYQLDWAIGTTYSLDLVALLTVPLACTLPDCEDSTGKPIRDPLALLKSLRECADRVCVFCQAGHIAVPATYRPLFLMLEESVVQALSPRGGNFHPKVWVLRFSQVNDPATVRYRFLCLTRNLTFDRSWDTLLCLEGPLKNRVRAYQRNHPLADFIAALPGMATHAMPEKWTGRWDQIVDELRKVDFEPFSDFEEIFFRPIGIEGHPSWPFSIESERIDKLLAISPFVDDSFLERIIPDRKLMSLVSRPESLMEIEQSALLNLQDAWILDDSAEPEADDGEEVTNTSDDPLAVDDCNPLTGLHAKLFVAEQGWNARIWTGSANATSAAFDRNVEFLVELVGKRSKCGIDAVLGEASDNQQMRRVNGLRDMLRPFIPDPTGTCVVSSELKFERVVDRLSKELSRFGPVARCEPLDGSDQYSMKLFGTIQESVSQPNVSIKCWPISLGESRSQDLQVENAVWATFTPVSFEALTAFFAVEVTDLQDPTLKRRFVLRAILENPPEDRRERLLVSMLSDRQRVLRYLLLLLLSEDSEELVRILRGDLQDPAAGSTNNLLLGSTLLEPLLEALAQEPARIERVAQVLHDLRSHSKGPEVLPDDFDVIWQPIYQYYKAHFEPAALSAVETPTSHPVEGEGRHP